MNTMTKMILVASVAVAALAAPASATVLTFDNLVVDGSGAAIGNGYQGFNWQNVYAINGPARGDGYAAGVVSSPNVIFNGYGDLATVSSASAFTLNSGYFTGAFADQAVTIIGYNGATQVFSDTFDILRSGPTLHNFSNASITSFTFLGSDSHIVIDNLTVNAAAAVPETATWGMMIAGFGMMGAALRTRRRSTTVTFA